MALALTPGYAFATTEQVTAAKLALLVSAAAASGIDQTNLASGSGLVITASSSPSNTNALWIDSSSSNTLKYYTGSVWTAVSTSGPPVNYRSQFYCMQASTVTITVAPGILEINATTITKTANTTLTLTTAGDWAGGASLQAVSTTGYIGVDVNGNIKMHTTAPAFADYALSISAANNTKRYVQWSGITYRVIGWFRMNATGSGQLDVYGVSNIADGNVKNVVFLQTGAVATGTTNVPDDDTIPQNTEGDQYMSLGSVFTNLNNRIRVESQGFFEQSNGSMVAMSLFQDATANALVTARGYSNNANAIVFNAPLVYEGKATLTTYTTFKIRVGGTGGFTITFNGTGGARRYAGVMGSYMKIIEEEAQLT